MIYDRHTQLPISLLPASTISLSLNKIRKVINHSYCHQKEWKESPFCIGRWNQFQQKLQNAKLMPLSISSSSPSISSSSSSRSSTSHLSWWKVVGCEQVSVPLVVIGSTEPSLHNVSNNVWQGNIFEFAFQHRSLFWVKKTEICNPFNSSWPWQDKLTIETIDGKT